MVQNIVCIVIRYRYENPRRLPSGKHTNILFVIGGVNTACWLWRMPII